MPPVHVRGQMCSGHGCFPPRPSVEGDPTFTVRGVPVHCEGHAWAAHGCADCAPHGSVLARGAPRVTVRGRGIARVGDLVACGSRVAEGVADFTVGDGPAGAAAAARVAALQAAVVPVGFIEPVGGDPAAVDPAVAGNDGLLQCLPHIARAEAQRARAAGELSDAQGWGYLQQFFTKWFAGAVAGDEREGEVTRREARAGSYVDMDWLLSYERARVVYDDLVANIVNEAARVKLAEILCREGYLGDGPRDFDFIAVPEHERHALHHQHGSVDSDLFDVAARIARNSIIPGRIDGMSAALLRFSFYGSVAGMAAPKADGGYLVTVERVAIFMRDSFDFAGEQPHGLGLGRWDCDSKSFSALPFSGGARVWNADFRAFRRRHGRGGDFYVYAGPRVLADFKPVSFDLPSGYCA